MRRFYILIFLILVAWQPPSMGADAEGMDLIFLIDQSGSMMGKGATSVRNDPYGKRFDAVQALKDRLIDSAMNGMTNRISVIEFGGRNAKSAAFLPQVTLSRLDIPPVPRNGNPDTVRRLIEGHLGQLKQVFRGDTDHGRALQLAVEEVRYFQNHPPPVGTGGKPGPREQVVVLITDGAAYAEGVNAQQMKGEIRDQVQRLKQEGPTQIVTLSVFGLADKISNYWHGPSDWGELWNALATKDPETGKGLAYFLFSDDEAVPKILEVISELIPPFTSIIQPSNFYVAPPYLRGLDFAVDFDVPSLPLSEIDIRDPDDQSVSVTSAGSGYATAVIDYPKPGKWRLNNPNSRYTVTVTPRYESATLVEPLGPVARGSQVSIRYQLSGPQGLYQPWPQFPHVQFQLNLTGPDGQETLVPVSESGGYAKSQNDVLLDQQGTYTLAFEGTVLAADGSQHTVYSSAQAGGDTITVNDATPLALRLEAPTQNSIVSLLNGKVEVPIQLRFYNHRTGAALSPQEVLQAGVELEVAYLSEKENTASKPGTPLQVTAQELEAQLPVDFRHTRWDLICLWDYCFGKPDTIRLQVSPDKFWKSDFRFLGLTDGDAYLLSAPIRIQESLFSLWPILVGLLGVILLWLVWRQFGRPWWLARRDRKWNQHPQLVFRLSQNPSVYKNWSLRGKTQLKPANTRVELAQNPSPDEAWDIEKFKIKRLSGLGKEVVVKLSYQPKDGKPLVKAKLTARDNSGRLQAKHKVQGLAPQYLADFVLMIDDPTTSM